MHIVLEHSADLLDGVDPILVMQALYDTAATHGLMKPEDIKVRLWSTHDYLIGGVVQPFGHLTASLLAGRTGQVKLALSQSLLAQLCKIFPDVERLSVDVREMDDAAYKKRQYNSIG